MIVPDERGITLPNAIREWGDGPVETEESILGRLIEVETMVESVVASWQSIGAANSRRWHRVQFDQPICITPLQSNSYEPIADPMSAQGVDISVAGISFQHERPLAFSRVAIHFLDQSDIFDAIVTHLSWCRFSRSGVYQSGGRFLRTVTFGDAVDWNSLAPA